MSTSVWHKIHLYCCCLTALSIPVYPKAVPITIVLTLASKLVLLFTDRERWSKKLLYPFLSCCALLFTYLVALLYTSDLKEGFTVIETNLSMLVFPIVFITGRFFERRQQKTILQWFVAGCLLGMLLCLAQAGYTYYDEKADMAKGIVRDNFGYYFFFSARLSPWIHPSYMALYTMFALMILYFVPFEEGMLKGRTRYFVSGAIIVFLFLLSSKSGFVALGIFGVFVFIHQVFFLRRIWVPLISVLLSLAVFFFLYLKVPEFSFKINMAWKVLSGERQQGESSTVRVEIWQVSLDLIRSHPVTGLGTGDVKNELVKKYVERKMALEAERGLNCHNQFFQSMLAAGIPGLLALLYFLAYPLVKGIRKRSAFTIAWVVLLVVNLLVESMLQTQAGVVFCAFFAAFFGRMLVEENTVLQTVKE